jgi:molybdate transport system substrate-binding protein
MMRPAVWSRLLAVGLALASHSACAREAVSRPVGLDLYAAASLREALTEAIPAVERATGVLLALNLGASSELARQILAARKADIYFSADEAWMDKVAAAGLVDQASRRSPLSNRLVVVVPRGSQLAIAGASDLAAPAVRRLSLANPELVPAGKYARAWLESRGVWAALSGRVVPALDVRAALAAVESGAADAGVVYRTDAAISRRVRTAWEVPEHEGPLVSYAVAPLAGRPHLASARAVVAWLCGAEAGAIFERHGFVLQPSAP